VQTAAVGSVVRYRWISRGITSLFRVSRATSSTSTSPRELSDSSIVHLSKFDDDA
jgi:hypothetical protein